MNVMTHGDCLFCRIISGDLPSTKVYESEQVVAFTDIQPSAPVHILVVPRRHLSSVHDLGAEDAQLALELMVGVNRVASELNLTANGYRVVTNVGAWGGQTVPHLHFHVLGGRELGAMG